MTAKTSAITPAFVSLVENFPAGTLLHHRTSGDSAIVIGWIQRAGGEALLMLDYGPDKGIEHGHPLVWTTKKPNLDAEPWQEDGHEPESRP